LKFFPVELARLGIKSVRLSEKGCVLGGRWGKCYLRMRQIMRLLKYSRRVVDTVKAAGIEHPAYTYVTSTEVENALKVIAGNIATGFHKHNDDDAKEALTDLGNLQDTIKTFIDEAEEKEDRTLSDAEKQNLEDCLTAEAMLNLTGTTLADEQRAALCAHVEANRDANKESFNETLMDQEEAGLDKMIADAKTDDVANLEEEEEAHNDDEDDEEDAEIAAEDREELRKQDPTTTSTSTTTPTTTTTSTTTSMTTTPTTPTTTTSDTRVRRTDSLGAPLPLDYDSDVDSDAES